MAKKTVLSKSTNKAQATPTNAPSTAELEEPTPSQAFFSSYSSFTHDKNSSVASEFYRLCNQYGWKKGDQGREEAFEGYRKALSIQFNNTYGSNENGLQEWQKLCEAIGINPIPTNMKDCREIQRLRIAVRNAHINLVDLIDKTNAGTRVNIFPSEMALSQYTKSTGKFFPLDLAHAGGLLKYLLRHIMSPRRGEAGI
ncbi:hypothetical protein F5I97DRAFT_1811764 [Phlebopus sp. FC_14]|nr:hypothetical protein F5I97DRAFT_1811764 [Phlebopus sp. FC_14]